MKTQLFIDATIRPDPDSRTWELCQEYLESWRKEQPEGNVKHRHIGIYCFPHCFGFI